MFIEDFCSSYFMTVPKQRGSFLFVKDKKQRVTDFKKAAALLFFYNF